MAKFRIVPEVKNPVKLMDAKITLDDISMDQVIDQVTLSSDEELELGQLVKAKVLLKGPNRLLVEVSGVFTGLITGNELQDAEGTFQKISEGDEFDAVVIAQENEDGQYTLSIRRAAQERSWIDFQAAYENNEVITVVADEANKGGLLLDINGIKGFIPVSQLSPVNYPRVNNADQDAILDRLGVLVGKEFEVRILTINKSEGKLIFSERKAEEERRGKALETLKVGQAVSGVVSGIVDFGIFVTFEGLEGLVHISEIAWSKVNNPHDFAKEGDKVEVLIIGLEEGKISLSIKRLTPDPWIEAAQNLEVGKTVKGKVSRLTQFGAFLSVNEHIDGLIHLSEISHSQVRNPGDFISVGEEYEAKVISLDLESHRLGLSLKALMPAPEGSEEAPKKRAPRVKKADKKSTEKKVEKKEESKEA
ncbi:MAG: S1 RNA-binding domain-containing protein [Patescibacteria group bacterium]|nr:S1 RNA-binding domain-containing protein [Patescibacteria group bacterium]